MALVWSFGAPLHSGGRHYFNDFLHQEIQTLISEENPLIQDLEETMLIDQ